MSSVFKIHHYLLKSHFLKSLRSSSLEENGSSFIAYMYSIIKSVIIQSFIHLTNHCFEVCNSFWTLESRNSVTFDGAPHAGQGSDDGRTVTPSRRRGLKSSMRSLSLWYAFLLSQLGTQNMGTYLYGSFSFFPCQPPGKSLVLQSTWMLVNFHIFDVLQWLCWEHCHFLLTLGSPGRCCWISLSISEPKVWRFSCRGKHHIVVRCFCATCSKVTEIETKRDLKERLNL